MSVLIQLSEIFSLIDQLVLNCFLSGFPFYLSIVTGSFLQSHQYYFQSCSVRVMFTTASPLQLCLKLNSAFASPAHILCLVGNPLLYAEIFLALNECHNLNLFKSLTLLVPQSFKKNVQR
jgi:hypothetical protein